MDHKCERCGKCCNMGTIWLNSGHPIIQQVAAMWPETHYSDDGQCAMFASFHGAPTCMLEHCLGWAAKPKTCRDYPWNGKCQREEGKSDGKDEAVGYVSQDIGR